MKRIILQVLLAGFLCSCNSNVADEQPFDNSEFILTTLPTSKFVTEVYGADRSMSFKTKGKVKNNSSNIYSSVIIESNIRVFLENGTVLTNKDIDPNPFFFDGIGGSIRGQWEPKEEKAINLSTPRMNSGYAKYPIRKVLIDYIIKGDDKTNGQHLNSTFKTEDVTDKWNDESKKFLTNSTDFDKKIKLERKKYDEIISKMPKYKEE